MRHVPVKEDESDITKRTKLVVNTTTENCCAASRNKAIAPKEDKTGCQHDNRELQDHPIVNDFWIA